MNTPIDSVENALRELHKLVVRYIEDEGGCDHSVGICVCGEVRLAEDAKEIIERDLTKIRAVLDATRMQNSVWHSPIVADALKAYDAEITPASSPDQQPSDGCSVSENASPCAP